MLKQNTIKKKQVKKVLELDFSNDKSKEYKIDAI